MTLRHTTRSRKLLATALAALAAAAIGTGCGADQPESVATGHDLRPALKDAPAELKRLYARSNRILDGGPTALKRQIAALEGTPIVVNKWASWCGPCRFEFPFFQRLARKRAGEVAFLGVNSLDARGDARKFLEKFPVPYPSFFDPEGDVAKVFRGDRVFPTTAFYGSDGELAFTKQGGYSSAAAIREDIARYAR